MHLRERLLASDPPAERLRLAARSIIALALAGLPLVGLIRVHAVDANAALLGALVAVFATFQANDVAPRARQITGALLAFPAMAAVSLTALLENLHPAAAAAGFLVIAYPAVWIRRYGPRAFGLGMMAIVASFYTLFLSLKAAEIPPSLGTIAIGAAAAWIAHFIIFPDSPRLALRSARTAFCARLQLVASATARAQVRTECVALDAAALTIDRLIAGHAFVIDAAQRSALRIALLDAEVYADGARVDTVVQTALAAPAGRSADAPMASGPKPPDIGGLKPATRQAWQVTIASLLAMVLGALVPPHQYPWALLTAFIVYAGAASAAEARRRSFSRVAGTTVGVAAGLAIIEFARGRHPLEIGLACIGLFAATYAFRASYVAFTFFLTITIATLYDVAGRPAETLLIARLIETIVGALCGALAATVVVPLKTSAVVATLGAQLARALQRSIASSSALETGGPRDRALDDARDLDAQLHEFLARARPLLDPPGAPPPGARETEAALIDCVACARSFTLAALTRGGSGALDLAGATDELARAFERMADREPNWPAIASGLSEIAAGIGAPAAHPGADTSFVGAGSAAKKV